MLSGPPRRRLLPVKRFGVAACVAANDAASERHERTIAIARLHAGNRVRAGAKLFGHTRSPSRSEWLVERDWSVDGNIYRFLIRNIRSDDFNSELTDFISYSTDHIPVDQSMIINRTNIRCLSVCGLYFRMSYVISIHFVHFPCSMPSKYTTTIMFSCFRIS